MSQTKLNQLLEQITSELIANGVRLSEACERARNIAQAALLEGELTAKAVYGIISPSAVVTGVVDTAKRAEAAELLSAIWTAEAGR
jgi:hypothetical protein